MVVTYLGRVAVFCGVWTACLGMSVVEKTVLPAKGGDTEIVKSVEQFCRIVSDQFGGPEVLCNANDKLAKEIKQYIEDNKSVAFVRGGSVKDHAGRSPLAMAVQYGQLCLIQAFLLVGGNVDETDNCGRTPLHRAVMITWDQSLDVMPILEFLIKNNANPCLLCDAGSNGEEGKTPAQLARYNGFEKAARYLEQQEKVYKQAHEKVAEADDAALAALEERLLEGMASEESDNDDKS